jgi:hypothetical protein
MREKAVDGKQAHEKHVIKPIRGLPAMPLD